MNPFFFNYVDKKNNRISLLGFEKEYNEYDVEKSLERRYRNRQLWLERRTKLFEFGAMLISSIRHLIHLSYPQRHAHAKVIVSRKHGSR